MRFENLFGRFCVLTLLIGCVIGWLVGCSEPKVETPQAAPPSAIFTGPSFLRGTIGSLTRLRGAQAQLASGYGLVVNLRGTGSADVPAFLRVWMINEMRKKGVGSARYAMDGMSPERMLGSTNTAVVLVQGLVPPGAVKGTRFDVLVSALPQTQTTSLQGGQLWTADLATGGQDPSVLYRHKSARSSGTLYVNPVGDGVDGGEDTTLYRQAVVLGGGTVSANRKLELILNQPSWQQSRAIADRINERFPKSFADPFDTAVPVTDVLVRLNIPKAYSQQPDELLALISHLYLQRSAEFEPQQAQRLADLLVADESLAEDIVLAWQSLGKTALPVLRRYYEHQRVGVSLAALRAGAQLSDQAAVDGLAAAAEHEDPEHRLETARILAYLPDSIRGSRVLHRLLDDEDQAVRLEAYESLATMNDPIIQRVSISDRQGFKFMLDVVPSEKSLVYITQLRAPRLVVFNDRLGFRTPFLARIWDNRLMLRSDNEGEPLTLFYQANGDAAGRTFTIPPRVVDLVAVLAQREHVSTPGGGLDLSYGQTARVVHHLCLTEDIDAPVVLKVSPLSAMIERAQQKVFDKPRPETGDGGSL